MSTRRTSTVIVSLMCGFVIGSAATSALLNEPIEAGVCGVESESPVELPPDENVQVGLSARLIRTDVAPNTPDVEQLRQEVERLRSRLARREGLRAADVARAVPGLSETEVAEAIARSSLIVDEAGLAEMGESMAPADVWRALLAEGLYHIAMSEARASGPKGTAAHAERVLHYQTVVVPRSLRAFEELSQRLYELRVPRRLVEAFRVRVVEGI